MEALFRDEGLSVLNEGSLFVMLWKQAPTLERTGTVGRLMRTVHARQPEGLAALSVVLETATLPSMEVRRAVASLLTTELARVRVAAVVLSGEGFQRSLTRSFFTALLMVVRPRTRPVFVSELSEGLAHVLGASADRARLEAELREHLRR